MSSTESSGAPAEGTATPPADANSAPVASFGTSRGSGLARGKRPTSAPAATAAAPVSSSYKPTAIEIVTAPREYQNPFAPATPEPAPEAQAPVETPAAPAPETPVAAAPAPVAPVAPAAKPAPTSTPDLFPLDETATPAAPEGKVELHILPPERTKTTPAQTWESEGFRPPAREPRGDRPRRDDRQGGEQRRDREPRENRPEGRDPNRPPRQEFQRRDDRGPRPSPAPAPAKPTGFFAKLKAFFSGGESAPAAPAPTERPPREGGERREGRGDRHHRGGRGRGHYRQGGGQGHEGGGQGGPGGQGFQGGESRGEGREDGGFRRRRGGRGGRNRGGDRGGYRGGPGGGGDSHPQA